MSRSHQAKGELGEMEAVKGAMDTSLSPVKRKIIPSPCSTWHIEDLDCGDHRDLTYMWCVIFQLWNIAGDNRRDPRGGCALLQGKAEEDQQCPADRDLFVLEIGRTKGQPNLDTKH